MYFVRRAQSRIDQATLENEIVDNSRSGGDRERSGALLARRTRTFRKCSFDARRQGQPGHSLPRERCSEHFSLDLLSFLILLTFNQQFCSR